MVRDLSDGHQKLVAKLDKRHPDILVSTYDQKSDLHDQHNLIVKYDIEKNHQELVDVSD